MLITFDRRSIILLVVISLAALAAACGGSEDDPATARPISATSTSIPATATTSASLVGDAIRGETAFTSESCSACHSTGDNRVVGPGLLGVSSRAASLGGDAYIEESIRNPLAVIAPGFTAGIMSDFSHLDDQTIADLVAYLNTLN